MPGMMAPQQRQFNPYSENGGTILAIAGADFSVIAGDTRQTEGFNIQTRYAPKVFRLCVFELELHCFDTGADLLRATRFPTFHDANSVWIEFGGVCGGLFRTDKAVLAVNGFAADGNMFVKKVKQRLEVSPCTRHPFD